MATMRPDEHATIATACAAILTGIRREQKLRARGTRKGAREKTRAAITEWNEQRQKNVDADLLEKRAALMGNVEPPDTKRIDLMASHMLKHPPNELAILYNSASEIERREMEAASASIGRLPVKIEGGGVRWQTLLDPEMVAEAILGRAEATNPAAAQQVRELREIKATQTTIAGVALSEV